MNYTIGRTQQASQMINVICGLLFLSFCFCFLAYYQVDFISLVQHYYSHGRNVSHGIVLPVLITLGLTLLGVGQQIFFHTPIRLRALNWVPSFLLLSMLTSLKVGRFTEGASSLSWYYYLLLFVLYMGGYYVAMTIRESRSENNSVFVYLWPNLLILVISGIFVISTGNTDRRLHAELRMERAIGEGRWQDAKQLILSQKTVTPYMASLYAYALSETDSLALDAQLFPLLGERGSDALLPSLKDSLRPWNVPAMLREKLGRMPATDMNATRYMDYLQHDTMATPAVRQWLLTGYLADRNLSAFTRELLVDYPPIDTLKHVYTIADSLPSTYHEALFVYTLQSEAPIATLEDSLLLQRYEQFRLFNYNLQESRCPDSLCTYWNYYFSRPLSLKK